MSEFASKLKIQKCQTMADKIADKVPLNKTLYDAFVNIDREIFISKGLKQHAYRLDALPLSQDQWISSPLTVAKMTLALDIDKSVDSILEIGCGSGYQAAILSKLIRRVFTIERIESLLLDAKKCFKTLGISNIHARFDDGQRGWRDYAPYDRILLSASIEKVPDILFEQLRDGGILVAPMEVSSKSPQKSSESIQQLITQFTKTKSGIRVKTLEECLFVPIIDGTNKG
ncbi:MAG: protein-L-isoaspartate(D-aspartate) O-methyltransferase [Campylobacteraceae bacterium]|jgi:protein-L-isoaspartate(D-aspartate) O-methyltransferase|nr:protein-L-isoaspartate(D-aspartate) O-methyltransferase [Campylobacteraceae bacterium]